MPITILFPLPDPALSPNSRCRWWVKAPITKKYRADCGYIAQDAVRGIVGLPWGSAVAVVAFRVSDPGRRRDMDNALASLKAAWDGLSGVVYVDDRALRVEPADPFWVKCAPKDEGVLVELRERDEPVRTGKVRP